MSLETSHLRFTGVNLVDGVYELQTERQTIMDNILFIPGIDYTPTDPDAKAYVSAVQVADNQPLESSVKRAINDLVVGLKADGVWSSLQSAVLMAAARTVAGAMVPLRGAAPVNNGFVQDDYHRLWGLKSDGTKWVNTNRANNADGQNDCHNAVWVHTHEPIWSSGNYLKSSTNTGENTIGWTTGLQRLILRNRTDAPLGLPTDTDRSGLTGHSRVNSAEFARFLGIQRDSLSSPSFAPDSNHIYAFARNAEPAAAAITRARMRWYSIGSSLSLSALEARLRTFFGLLRLFQPTQMNVFLIGGQSNSEGRTTMASAPAYLIDRIPATMMWNGEEPDNYYLHHYGRRGNGAFWSVAPATNYWGPFDVTLNDISESLPNVIAVRVSAGGTVIDSVASPTASRGSWSDRFGDIPSGTPALLQALEQRVDALKAWATTNGVQLNFRGMFWHQGEADQQVGGSSVTNYESNWQDVVDYIRGFTRADLPIIYGTVSDESTLFNSTIKAAQLAVAAGDSNLYCRDNDGLAMIGGGDTTHFSAASTVTFGEWAAETWLQNYG
jgi:hypothetical protein